MRSLLLVLCGNVLNHCWYREHADGFEYDLAWTLTELQRLERCRPQRKPDSTGVVGAPPTVTADFEAPAPEASDEEAEVDS